MSCGNKGNSRSQLNRRPSHLHEAPAGRTAVQVSCPFYKGLLPSGGSFPSSHGLCRHREWERENRRVRRQHLNALLQK